MKMEKQEIRITVVQLIKYGIVGVSNSLITLAVIFVFNSLLNFSLLIADVLGYVAGVINSFIWNKQWVFKTHDTKLAKEMGLFVTGFLICFALQFITLLIITKPTIAIAEASLGSDFAVIGMDAKEIGEYAAVIIGMVVYTLSNYIFNRFVTFKKAKMV